MRTSKTLALLDERLRLIETDITALQANRDLLLKLRADLVGAAAKRGKRGAKPVAKAATDGAATVAA